MLLLCYFFFQKKDNQKKVKIFAIVGGSSACRANDTQKHPYIHIYVILPCSLPLTLYSIRFFPCVFRLPVQLKSINLVPYNLPHISQHRFLSNVQKNCQTPLSTPLFYHFRLKNTPIFLKNHRIKIIHILFQFICLMSYVVYSL